MPASSAGPVNTDEKLRGLISNELGMTGGAIAWSSFFFAVLQSICTLFIAVNGLRLLLGIGALAISAGFAAELDTFHHDWIRVPMIVLALGGSLLNIAILIQIQVLRNRPASRWRQVPLSRRKVWMERFQWVVSLATVALVVVEELLHRRIAGHL